MLLPEITVSLFEFFGVAVAHRSLNGIWIDFSVVMLMWIYLNNFSFWIIKKDFKIVKSERTRELLRKYWLLDLHNQQNAEAYDDDFYGEITKQFR